MKGFWEWLKWIGKKLKGNYQSDEDWAVDFLTKFHHAETARRAHVKSSMNAKLDEAIKEAVEEGYPEPSLATISSFWLTAMTELESCIGEPPATVVVNSKGEIVVDIYVEQKQRQHTFYFCNEVIRHYGPRPDSDSI